jgi:hypothetical protein
MKDILKIMMVKSELYKANEEVLAEFELSPNEPGELLELPSISAPFVVEQSESCGVLSDVAKFKAVLADHQMCISIRDKITSSAILTDFEHTVFVRAGVSILSEVVGGR